jgi:hypothetical protein
MAQASYVQSSFLGGERSKFYQGRIDLPDYRTGMNVCLNGFPTETGGWVRRPGFRFAAFTRSGLPAKVVKFDFQANSPYTMEFTDNFIRMFSGTSPVNTNDGVAVLAISNANPAVVQLASSAPAGWANSGDNFYFSGLGTTVPTLQNRMFVATKINATHWSIADAINQVGIDGSTLGAVSGNAVFNHCLMLISPYAGGTWANVRSVQTETTAVLLLPTVYPHALAVTAAPAPPNFATFKLTSGDLTGSTYVDGPYLDPVTTGETITPSATGSGAGFTLTASAATFQPGGFTANDVGRLIRLFSEPALWVSGAAHANGDVVKYAGTYYINYTGAIIAGQLGVPSLDGANWKLYPTGAKWAWAVITAITSTTVVTATIFDVQFADGSSGATYGWSPGLLWTTPIVTWRLGLWTINNYPSCGTYSDGRLWLSGVVPNRFDASRSNRIFDFTPTGPDGSVNANNAISYTFNAPDANPIFWMEPDLQGIIAGTKAGEWLIVAPTTGGFSPTNISARRVTRIGCANVEPRRTEHTLVVVHKFLRKIVEYFADVFSGKFTAPQITLAWKHLTIGNVAEIAYQQDLNPIVWSRVNNALVGCTYKRDTLMTSNGPTFAGGHRHVLGSGRIIESMAVGPSIGGNLDALTIVTDANGLRHVEVLTDTLDEGTPLWQASYLDDAVAPSSTTTSITTPAPYGGLTLNGLWHLNGSKVTAWIGGLDCGDYTVINGSITVPYGDGIADGTAKGLFTQAFVSSWNPLPALVGFTYTSQGQIVRPAGQQESGARAGPAFGKIRRNHQYAVLLEGAQGVSFGSNFAKMDPANFKDDAGNAYAINQQFSGIFWTTVTDDYSRDGMLAWQITRPYICNVIAIGGYVMTQDM